MGEAITVFLGTVATRGGFVFFISFKLCVVNVNISVLRRLHRDINGNNGRVDVVALAVGWRDKNGRRKARRSSWSKEGVPATLSTAG